LIDLEAYQVDRFGCISMLIDLELYQCDRFWSSIRGNKYPRHIKLIDLGVLSVEIEFGVVFVEINIQYITIDRYPKKLSVEI
jgi:hypothetical protein